MPWKSKKLHMINSNAMIERDQTKHAANLENFEQALGSVRRDRESMRTEVQTLSTQLTEALTQVGNLTAGVGRDSKNDTECSLSQST